MVTANYTIDKRFGHQALGSTTNELTIGTSGHGVQASAIESIELFAHKTKKAYMLNPLDGQKEKTVFEMVKSLMPKLNQKIKIMHEKPLDQSEREIPDTVYKYIGIEFKLGKYPVRCIASNDLVKYAIKKSNGWDYCRSSAMIKKKAKV